MGQVVATNTLTFRAGQNGLAIAVELLSTHTAGAPVVDRDGKYLGFINEFDVMKALSLGRELSSLVAEDLMRVGHTTSKLGDALKLVVSRARELDF